MGSKKSEARNSLADCEDLMLCVLGRLPVKSICRFKSVCKSWNHLFSTQEFIKTQFKLSSKSKKNQSFLVGRVIRKGSNTISVFNIDQSNENNGCSNTFNLEPKAKYRFYHSRVGNTIVGCCNGLVCIKFGQEFVLWNPALNLSKTVSSPSKEEDHGNYFCDSCLSLGFGYEAEGDDYHGMYFSDSCLSLGFGYEAEGDDFKVVSIVWLKIGLSLSMRLCCVEVYSVNSESWTKIDPGFEFSKLTINRIENSATVNGNPYWAVKLYKNDVLICFDMSKLVFKIVPLSSLDYNKAEQGIGFVYLNGSLGALVSAWDQNEGGTEYVDSWVFDDDGIWTKSHSVRLIDHVKMDPVLRSLKDGRVLGMGPERQLIVFNSETERVEDLFYVGRNYEICDYTASMAYVKGMEKV